MFSQSSRKTKTLTRTIFDSIAMTTAIHQFRDTKLQLVPVINDAKRLTDLRHD